MKGERTDKIVRGVARGVARGVVKDEPRVG